MQEAVELFDELQGLEYVYCPDAGKVVKHEARVKTIKARLAAIQEENDLLGLRHGTRAFASASADGKKSLDVPALKVALVNAGVDVGVVVACIEACTKTGDPYHINTFKLVNE